MAYLSLIITYYCSFITYYYLYYYIIVTYITVPMLPIITVLMVSL